MADFRARCCFLLLELRVVQIVALALRVDARDPPADLCLSEAFAGTAAVILLAFSLRGFLLSVFFALFAVLRSLAERLFLVCGRLGRIDLG